ncbi:MAG: M1 family metallopeptidase [Bacteroidia bacterium]
MIKLKLILFLLIFSCWYHSYSQEMSCYHKETAKIREHNVDMQSMKLHVSFEPEKGLVKGDITYDFKPLQQVVDSIFFDAPGIKFQQVQLNGQNVKYSTSPTGITVFPEPHLKFGSTDKVSFIYEATPRKGIYFIGWNDPENLSRKQIWTQGQGIDNRHWIPSYDEPNDKLITELIITFDADYKVLSNGKKISEKSNSNGTRTWHYKMSAPHAPYLVMIGIGKYDIKTSKSKSGVEINNYYYPEFPDRVEPTYRYTELMMDFLERETGIKYPWSQYSQIPVQEFMYGAMENTTATILGDFYLVDKRAYLDRNYINVNMHEMAHMWFGNYVTAWEGSSHWIQESFATYYPKVFTKEIFGEDYYQWETRNDQNVAINAGKQNQIPVAHSKGGTASVYQKGSLVIDMLRYVLGDDQFRRGINRFLKDHPYGNVDTHGMFISFHKELGVNLDWFFEQWLYGGGEPSYKVSWREYVEPPAGTQYSEFTVEQTHATGSLINYFKMPVVLKVHYTDGTTDSIIQWIENKNHVITIENPLGKAIDYVLFDPGNKILKTISFEKTPEMLFAQALRAPDMIDPYDAVAAMKNIPSDNKRVMLKKVFDQETFHYIKTEIISQLSTDDDTTSTLLILNALQDSDSKVRLAAVQNIKLPTPELIAELQNLLTDSSYFVIENALDKLISLHPEGTAFYLAKVKDEGMGKAIEIKKLEYSYLTGDTTAIKQLIKYTGQSYEFRTRINAMNSLQRLNYLDEEVITNMFNAMLSPNNRLAGPVAKVTEQYMKQRNFKTLITAKFTAQPWQDWEEKILQNTVK